MTTGDKKVLTADEFDDACGTYASHFERSTHEQIEKDWLPIKTHDAEQRRLLDEKDKEIASLRALLKEACEIGEESLNAAIKSRGNYMTGRENILADRLDSIRKEAGI